MAPSLLPLIYLHLIQTSQPPSCLPVETNNSNSTFHCPYLYNQVHQDSPSFSIPVISGNTQRYLVCSGAKTWCYRIPLFFLVFSVHEVRGEQWFALSATVALVLPEMQVLWTPHPDSSQRNQSSASESLFILSDCLLYSQAVFSEKIRTQLIYPTLSYFFTWTSWCLCPVSQSFQRKEPSQQCL